MSRKIESEENLKKEKSEIEEKTKNDSEQKIHKTERISIEKNQIKKVEIYEKVLKSIFFILVIFLCSLFLFFYIFNKRVKKMVTIQPFNDDNKLSTFTLSNGIEMMVQSEFLQGQQITIGRIIRNLGWNWWLK